MKSDRSGNVATMFGILIIPIIALVGSAVDYSNAYRAKSRVQQALDATSLAVNLSIGLVSEAELSKLAQSIFAENLGTKRKATLSFVGIDTGAHRVVLKAEAKSETTFMAVFGIHGIDVGARSETVIGQQNFEVAMVLDNSGSMRGKKLVDLRSAAETLTEVLFAGQTSSNTVKVGVVPFAAAVNVGPQRANSAWMDTNAVSPIHSENFSAPVNRFDLYNNISNVSWGGCVETRPYPLDVQDTAPTMSEPASYFVPMFAPDEPDKGNAQGKKVENNYLPDLLSGGNSSSNNGKAKGKGKGKGKGGGNKASANNGGTPPTWDEAQENVAKYAPGVKKSGRSGPNYNCTSTPITPLTGYKSDITTALSRMKANGMTNIHEGMMWGWRVLSPNAPFTQGVPAGQNNTIKFVVLMTDGANTHRSLNNPNMSMYSPYGYARNGRLVPPTSNTTTLVTGMNQRTLEACTNAKKDGIRVYTVAFELNNTTTLDLLRDCASSPLMAFTPNNGSDLIAAFNKIGTEISALRIAK